MRVNGKQARQKPGKTRGPTSLDVILGSSVNLGFARLPPMTQNLSELLTGCVIENNQLTANVCESWLQGRSVYGGAQAALAVRAMAALSGDLPIRTLQATLCSPIPAGTVTVEAKLLRESKNTRQIEARIIGDDETLALFIGIFGRSRDSVVVRDFRMPQTNAAGVKMPFAKGMPEFLKNFEATLLQGHFPGAGVSDSEHWYRLSLLDDANETSLAHVLAFADFPPPIGLSWLSKFTRASTMTWMLNFTGHSFASQPLQDWFIDVQLDAARDGYTQQTVTLFTPDGLAIARGTQCMVVFG